MDKDVQIWQGDCLELMGRIPDGSVDAIVTDPPYPEIDRPYGRMTEAAWSDMMDGVIAHARRILKPSGSAVFVLQANQEKIGKTRAWLFEFEAKWARQWNMVQDVYWWNISAPPTVHCHRDRGLMRPSVKRLVWLGADDCYRNQDEVLWTESDASKAIGKADMALKRSPSGMTMRKGRMSAAASDRGGTTPFNLIPIANANSKDSAGSSGHGAGTPEDLTDWWVRYICPPDGLVCDPFMGSGTTGLSAWNYRRRFVGIERHPGYFATASRRLESLQATTPLLVSA